MSNTKIALVTGATRGIGLETVRQPACTRCSPAASATTPWPPH